MFELFIDNAEYNDKKKYRYINMDNINRDKLEILKLLEIMCRKTNKCDKLECSNYVHSFWFNRKYRKSKIYKVVKYLLKIFKIDHIIISHGDLDNGFKQIKITDRFMF
jgi:hypothetical protein